MTFYNAIILDKGKIVGRTHITNLSRFSSPFSNWIVCHEGGRLTESLPSKLIGPHNPIAIKRRSCSNQQFPVEVKSVYGRMIPLPLTADTTVERYQEMLESEKVLPSGQQNLMFATRQLEAGYRLVDYNLMNGYIVRMALRSPGGSGSNPKDLVGGIVTESRNPIDPKNTLKACLYGLNIIGRCDNGDCESKKSGVPPVLNCGLIYCRLTGHHLDCPACGSKTFKPVNFVVAGARSAINFCKSGETGVKSILLESPGPYPKFVKFAEGNYTETTTMEYDEICVRTTDLDISPFFCNFCATFIIHKSCEASTPCGHYFHKSCARKFKECPICSAKLFTVEAVEKLFEFKL